MSRNPLSGWITARATAGFSNRQLAQCRRSARRLQREHPKAEVRGIIGAVFDSVGLNQLDDGAFHAAAKSKLAEDPHGDRWFGPPTTPGLSEKDENAAAPT